MASKCAKRGLGLKLGKIFFFFFYLKSCQALEEASQGNGGAIIPGGI